MTATSVLKSARTGVNELGIAHVMITTIAKIIMRCVNTIIDTNN